MAETDTLLAHLSWRFHPRMEEVAVAALAYVLNRYPASREGLDELLRGTVKDMRLSNQEFETEAFASDGTRPNVLQKGDDGKKERLFIEGFHDTRGMRIPFGGIVPRYLPSTVTRSIGPGSSHACEPSMRPR